MKPIIILGMALAVSVASLSCGSAKSDDTRAELIPAPLSGYKCFVIKDSDGKAVGGNCVKD